MQPHRQAHTPGNPLLWLCLALPVAIHFLLLYRYAVNAPRLDDFPEILTFLPDWHAATGLDDKLRVLFRDYQNHRYVLYHLLLIAANGIDFRIATLVGNIPLVLLCGLMTLAVARHPHKNSLLLLATLLVFNLQSWRAMFWGPLGTTNLLYPTVALLACWLVTRGPGGVVAAALTAIVLTLSHGSGPLLFVVLTLYLLLQYRQQHIAGATLAGWLLLTTSVLLLYFVLFPLHSAAGYSSIDTATLLTNIFSHSTLALQGLLALAGSHLLYNDATQPWKPALAVALGAAELGWLGYLVLRGYLRQYPALLLWLGFLLLTMMSMVAGRVIYGGIDQALQGHYKLLNGLLLWCVAVATLQWLHDSKPQHDSKPLHVSKQKRQQAGLCVTLALGAALYGGGLWLFLAPMQQFQQALAADIQQWQQTGKLEHTETRLYVKQPNRKLKAAVDGGFYDPGNP